MCGETDTPVNEFVCQPVTKTRTKNIELSSTEADIVSLAFICSQDLKAVVIMSEFCGWTYFLCTS